MTEDKTTVLQWLEHHFSVIFIKTPTQNIKIPHHNNNNQNKKTKPNKQEKQNKPHPKQKWKQKTTHTTTTTKKTPNKSKPNKKPHPQTPEIYILSWCKAPQQSDIGQVWPQEFQVTPAEQV